MPAIPNINVNINVHISASNPNFLTPLILMEAGRNMRLCCRGKFVKLALNLATHLVDSLISAGPQTGRMPHVLLGSTTIPGHIMYCSFVFARYQYFNG